MSYSKFVAATFLAAALGTNMHGQTTITIQAKSYIARMVTPQSEADGHPDAQTTKALGFDNLVGGRVQAYELMLATDLLFREDPPDGTKDSAQFRLWSQIQVNGKCQAGKIVNWNVSGLQMAVGREGSLEAAGAVMTPLSVTPTASGSTPQSSVTYHYAIKGRPNTLTTPAFDNIRPRGCTWIWHDVTGTASCSGNTLVVKSAITGSGFPSSRLWQNGELVSMRSQGPFDNLWTCSSTPGLVK